ncbi:hypothetical protein [Teredinibacter purpureus]|uniref:hypothetical protein n=1 Tax=Teredinibacter purpureus TaxID=2731756 RepID=UPI0013C513D7|nr:hypothetical protein [Teredinibacter purpureus]
MRLSAGLKGHRLKTEPQRITEQTEEKAGQIVIVNLTIMAVDLPHFTRQAGVKLTFF